MKKAVLSVFLVLALSFAFSQEQKTTEKKTTKAAAAGKAAAATDEAIKKMEKDLWEAWKNKDMKPFETHIADDGLSLDPMMGWQDKQTMLKSMKEQPCDVNSYSFGDEKITHIDKDAAIYAYTASVDATCGGQKVPDKVYASSTYAKRRGKWLAIFHQETPAMPPPSATTEKKQ